MDILIGVMYLGIGEAMGVVKCSGQGVLREMALRHEEEADMNVL